MLFSTKKNPVMTSGISEIKDEVKRSSSQNISSCIYQSAPPPSLARKDPVLFSISKEVKLQVCLPEVPLSSLPQPPQKTIPVQLPPPQKPIPPKHKTIPSQHKTNHLYAIPLEAIHLETIPPQQKTIPPQQKTIPPQQKTIPPQQKTIIQPVEAIPPQQEKEKNSKLPHITYEDIQKLIQASIANIPFKSNEDAVKILPFTKQDVLTWIKVEIENEKKQFLTVDDKKTSDMQMKTYIHKSLKEEIILPIVEKYLAKMIEEDSRVLMENDADLSEGARSKFEEMIEPAVGRIVQRIIKYDYEQDKIGFNETASMNLDINYDEVYDYELQEKSQFEAPLLVPQPPGMYNPMYETAIELTVPPENDNMEMESFYKAKGDEGKVFYVNELRSEYKSRKWIRFGNGIETGNVLDMVFDKTHRKIYIVGHFKHVNRIPIDNVAVYDVRENVWNHVGNGISSVATCVAIYEESQILFVGGVFTKVGKGETQTQANNIAAYYISENRWISLGDGLNRDCTTLVFDTKTEKLYAGGTFTQSGSLSMHYVGIYDLKSNTWTGLVGGEINGPCRCLMIANDTDLYIGGLFTHAGDTDIHASYVAKYDLEEHTWSDLAGGLQGYCNTLAYDATEGVVYVGGTFNSVGNKETSKDAHHIAKFIIASQTWETMKGGVNNVVNSLSFDEKDKCLYIGGAFTHTFEDNILLNHIGKFIPELDSWAPLANHFKNCKIPTDDKGNDNVGLNGVCRVMNLDDTSLFVAGSFQIAGSITANSIVRYVVKRGGGD
jgi:hypothetical protein